MEIKSGLGWKAGYNPEKGLYGIEVIDQGSWDLYEINSAIYSKLGKNTGSEEIRRLIADCRHLYFHVNDRCGPPYTVVLDEDYADYCPWMAKDKPAGKEWDKDLTDAVVELLDSEKKNREQRRNKRKKRLQEEKNGQEQK